MKSLFLYVSLVSNVISALDAGNKSGEAPPETGLRNNSVPAPTGAACFESSRCPRYTYEELWELEVKFWERFKYPANVEEAKSINSTLFAKDIQGRVDITRTFDGQELNTEYLFGLFTDPNSVTLVNLPLSYEITHFAANDYITAASTIVTFTSTLLEIEVPITIDTFIAWDDEGQVTQYDATFRWFNFLLYTFVDQVAKKFGVSSQAEAVAVLTTILAKSICQIHDEHCASAHQQYEDNASCVKFLTEDIRFGQDYELGRNTLLCRSIHQQMVQYRPDVHCPHIGPTGGGMCVDDQTYEQKVLEEYFTYVPFVIKPDDQDLG